MGSFGNHLTRRISVAQLAKFATTQDELDDYWAGAEQYPQALNLLSHRISMARDLVSTAMRGVTAAEEALPEEKWAVALLDVVQILGPAVPVFRSWFGNVIEQQLPDLRPDGSLRHDLIEQADRIAALPAMCLTLLRPHIETLDVMPQNVYRRLVAEEMTRWFHAPGLLPHIPWHEVAAEYGIVAPPTVPADFAADIAAHWDELPKKTRGALSVATANYLRVLVTADSQGTLFMTRDMEDSGYSRFIVAYSAEEANDTADGEWVPATLTARHAVLLGPTLPALLPHVTVTNDLLLAAGEARIFRQAPVVQQSLARTVRRGLASVPLTSQIMEHPSWDWSEPDVRIHARDALWLATTSVISQHWMGLLLHPALPDSLVIGLADDIRERLPVRGSSVIENATSSLLKVNPSAARLAVLLPALSDAAYALPLDTRISRFNLGLAKRNREALWTDLHHWWVALPKVDQKNPVLLGFYLQHTPNRNLIRRLLTTHPETCRLAARNVMFLAPEEEWPRLPPAQQAIIEQHVTFQRLFR